MALQPSPPAVTMTLPPNPFAATTSPFNADKSQPAAATATGRFSTRRNGDFEVTLTGEIDPMVQPELLNLERRFEAGGSALATVDLRAVTFFGSTGLNFLSELRQTAEQRGGSVILLGPSHVCLRTLALVGFDSTFLLAGP